MEQQCCKLIVSLRMKNLQENVNINSKFFSGVVDSEDIPLNLSRELLQDSALIRKLRTVIQNRTVRFLFDKSRKDAESYTKFFADYGIFIKEGESFLFLICRSVEVMACD